MKLFRDRLNFVIENETPQAELSRRSGVDQATISHIASGTTKRPGADKVFALWPFVFPESPLPTLNASIPEAST